MLRRIADHLDPPPEQMYRFEYIDGGTFEYFSDGAVTTTGSPNITFVKEDTP